jgi:hypothetical protein
MKSYVDEDLPYRAAAEARVSNIDTISAHEVGNTGAPR